MDARLPIPFTSAKLTARVSCGNPPNVELAYDKASALAAQRPEYIRQRSTYLAVKLYTTQMIIEQMVERASQQAMTKPR